jgi:hypothetical protein
MSNENNSSSIGFSGALAILFIGLKLTGYITWSWVWVLSPIWISITLAFIIVSTVIVKTLIIRSRE